jgi:hypothetical protein
MRFKIKQTSDNIGDKKIENTMLKIVIDWFVGDVDELNNNNESFDGNILYLLS